MGYLLGELKRELSRGIVSREDWLGMGLKGGVEVGVCMKRGGRRIYEGISSLREAVSEVVGMQVFSRVSARTDQAEFGNGRARLTHGFGGTGGRGLRLGFIPPKC